MKETIRGRRWQAAYKVVLAHLKSPLNYQDVVNDATASIRHPSSQLRPDHSSQLAIDSNDVSAIHDFLNNKALVGHIKLFDYMINAIGTIFYSNKITDPLFLLLPTTLHEK